MFAEDFQDSRTKFSQLYLDQIITTRDYRNSVLEKPHQTLKLFIGFSLVLLLVKHYFSELREREDKVF